MEIPKTLNIGSGKDFKRDCINIDKDEIWKPDIIYDLNKSLCVGGSEAFHTLRFGGVAFKKNMFERIIANDVLEHITNLTVCMKSCLDLLEVGGVMEIIVPYDLSLGAWQDPTHVRAFNQNSWLYFTAWCWYLGWEKEMFELIKMEFKLSVLGKEKKENGWSIEKILDVPRATDGMRVELKKTIINELKKGG